MARAYSQDLRERVLEAAAKGVSARQAAERFGVGVSTAIVWVRRSRLDGERSAGGRASLRAPSWMPIAATCWAWWRRPATSR